MMAPAPPIDDHERTKKNVLKGSQAGRAEKDPDSYLRKCRRDRLLGRRKAEAQLEGWHCISRT